jgi:hypothetical protein
MMTRSTSLVVCLVHWKLAAERLLEARQAKMSKTCLGAALREGEVPELGAMLVTAVLQDFIMPTIMTRSGLSQVNNCLSASQSPCDSIFKIYVSELYHRFSSRHGEKKGCSNNLQNNN